MNWLAPVSHHNFKNQLFTIKIQVHVPYFNTLKPSHGQISTKFESNHLDNAWQGNPYLRPCPDFYPRIGCHIKTNVSPPLKKPKCAESNGHVIGMCYPIDRIKHKNMTLEGEWSSVSRLMLNFNIKISKWNLIKFLKPSTQISEWCGQSVPTKSIWWRDWLTK